MIILHILVGLLVLIFLVLLKVEHRLRKLRKQEEEKAASVAETPYVIGPPKENDLMLSIKDDNLALVMTKMAKLSYYSGSLGTAFSTVVYFDPKIQDKILAVRFSFGSKEERDSIYLALYSELSELIVE